MDHAHFQAIRPENVQAALEFLKANNPLYNDVIIAVENIPDELLTGNETVHSVEVNEEGLEESEPTEINNIEENENPLDKMRIGSSETVLVSNIPHVLDEETVTIAPR